MKAVFTIINAERLGKPLYRRIGTAFVNQDASLSVILDAVPLTGRQQTLMGHQMDVTEDPATDRNPVAQREVIIY